MSQQDSVKKRMDEDEGFRDHVEKAAVDPEFKKFLDEQDKREKELADHPYTRTKKILDEEFELVISYPKNGVPVGTRDHEGCPDGMEIIESILTDENPDALVTNDLEIIELTPDVKILVFAEETKTNAVYKDHICEMRDYTIHEYERK